MMISEEESVGCQANRRSGTGMDSTSRLRLSTSSLSLSSWDLSAAGDGGGPRAAPSLCRRHRPPRLCQQPDCAALHLCPLFADGFCPREDSECRWGHTVASARNKMALQRHRLSELPEQQLQWLVRELLQQTAPVSDSEYRRQLRQCPQYAANAACSDALCFGLHLCPRLVEGGCMAGVRCRWSHQVASTDNLMVLLRLRCADLDDEDVLQLLDVNRRLDGVVSSEQLDLGTDHSDLGTDHSDLGTDHSDLGTDHSDLGTDQCDLGTKQSDLGTDKCDLGTKQLDLGTDQSHLGTSQSDLGTDQSVLGTDKCDLGTEQSDLVTDKCDLGTKQSNLGTNQSDLGTNPSHLGTNPSHLGTNQSDLGTDQSDLARHSGLSRDQSDFCEIQLDSGFDKSDLAGRQSDFGSERSDPNGGSGCVATSEGETTTVRPHQTAAAVNVTSSGGGSETSMAGVVDSGGSSEVSAGGAAGSTGGSSEVFAASSGDGKQPAHGNTGRQRQQLSVCRHYCFPAKCADGEHCQQLHLCRFFVAGICPYAGDCTREHSLSSPHNRRVLRTLQMTSSSEQQVLAALRTGWLRQNPVTNIERHFLVQLCRHYANGGSCRRGDACTRLHVCESYVYGTCTRRSDCLRSHHLDSPLNTAILRRLELDGMNAAQVLDLLTSKISAKNAWDSWKPGQRARLESDSGSLWTQQKERAATAVLPPLLKPAIAPPKLTVSYSRAVAKSKPPAQLPPPPVVAKDEWVLEAAGDGELAVAGSDEPLAVEVEAELLPPRLCAAHAAGGPCLDRECHSLHVCGFFLANICRRADSRCCAGHSFQTEHNLAVMARHQLIGSSPEHLQTLLDDITLRSRIRFLGDAQLRVQLCLPYNSPGGCAAAECVRFHVCHRFLAGSCGSAGNATCGRSHTLGGQHNLAVWKTLGLRRRFHSDSLGDWATDHDLLELLRAKLGVPAGRVEKPTECTEVQKAEEPAGHAEDLTEGNPAEEPNGCGKNEHIRKLSGCAEDTPAEKPTSCAEDKLVEKPTSGVEDKTAGKPTSCAEDKSDKKSTSCAEDKPAKKSTSGAEDQPAGKPTSCAENKPDKKSTSGAEDQPAGKPTSCAEDKPDKKPTSDTEDKTAGKPTSCAEDKPAKKSKSGAEDQPTGKPTSCAEDKPAKKSTSGAEDKPAKKSTSGVEDQPAGKPTSCAEGKPDKKSTSGAEDQPAGKPTSCAEDKTAGKPTSCVEDKPAKKPTSCAEDKTAGKTTSCAEDKPDKKPTSCAEDKPIGKPTNGAKTGTAQTRGEANGIVSGAVPPLCGRERRGVPCRDTSCRGLHLCPHWLRDGCRRGSTGGVPCILSHQLNTLHNRRLLGISGRQLDADSRRALLTKVAAGAGVRSRSVYTQLRVCLPYNQADGCGGGPHCLRLHICQRYLAGTCTGDCSLSHNVMSIKNRRRLSALDLGDADEHEVLELLRAVHGARSVFWTG